MPVPLVGENLREMREYIFHKIRTLVPPEIVPGRMTLLVTVFLVLVNIFNTITTNIPKAEGLTGKKQKVFQKVLEQNFVQNQFCTLVIFFFIISLCNM